MCFYLRSLAVIRSPAAGFKRSSEEREVDEGEQEQEEREGLENLNDSSSKLSIENGRG